MSVAEVKFHSAELGDEVLRIVAPVVVSFDIYERLCIKYVPDIPELVLAVAEMYEKVAVLILSDYLIQRVEVAVRIRYDRDVHTHTPQGIITHNKILYHISLKKSTF